MISNTLKYLPLFIRSRIESRPGLIKILDNISWLFFDKILRMGVGLIVGVWVARYLGPDQFGLLSFAIAFTALFGAITSMGLQEIVVRDIVRDHQGAGLTIGTAGVLQLVGGLASYLLIIGVITYLRPDDSVMRSIVAILGSMMFVKASDVAVYWFESQVQSKYIVWIQNSVFLVMAVVNVLLILNHAPLISFVWVMLVEALLIAALLLVMLGARGPNLRQVQVSVARAKTLMRDSWPLILSGIAITIYMKIDQIMLGQMIGDKAVGIYSAAVRISEVWYFIPMIIAASVFPAILEAKNQSETLYYQRLQHLYDLMVWLSVGVGIPMTFLSSPIVNLLYGPAFARSAPVLAIHIWAAVFVFLGVASGKWFIAENRQRLSLQRTTLGAVVNLILNLLLIPKFSEIGAAIATVISYGVAAFLSDAFQKETWPMFLMKIDSLNLTASIVRLLR